MVAHNASFDVGFMNANYERHDLPKITQPVIDTLEFARNLYPEYKRHGLGPLTKRFQVSLDHHHMANYDAEATGRLLFIFLKDAREKHGIKNLLQLNTDLVAEDSYKKRGLSMRLSMCKIRLVLKICLSWSAFPISNILKGCRVFQEPS